LCQFSLFSLFAELKNGVFVSNLYRYLYPHNFKLSARTGIKVITERAVYDLGFEPGLTAQISALLPMSRYIINIAKKRIKTQVPVPGGLLVRS
jgi:hypothetical protein